MKHKKLTDTDKPIVVNVGVNHWYPKGSKRLKGYLDKLHARHRLHYL
jgi:hypothetical protein